METVLNCEEWVGVNGNDNSMAGDNTRPWQKHHGEWLVITPGHGKKERARTKKIEKIKIFSTT